MSRTRSPAQLLLEAEECLRLHRLGYSMRDIADTMTAAGMKITKSTVQRRIELGIGAVTMPGIEDARRTLVEEHRATISVYGPMAAQGDYKAADIVNRSRQEIAKLIGAYAGKGIDKPTETPAPQPAAVAYLQRVIDNKPAITTHTDVRPYTSQETA